MPYTFTYPKREILLEIDGKNKTQNQVILHEKHLVFSDDLEFVGESKSRFTYLEFYNEKSYLQ